MSDKVYNVLFLCTGNSARSILAEGILLKEGAGRFNSYSAGSFPKGRPHRGAIATLEKHGHDTSFARSKSWDEFGPESGISFDFIFTVCDNAKAETCPVWPGNPTSAHWGVPDPDGEYETEAEMLASFEVTYGQMQRRIRELLELDLEGLDAAAILQELRAIGEKEDV